MGDFVIFIPLIIMVVVYFAAAPIKKFLSGLLDEDSANHGGRPKDAKYSRQVHQMHVKDAAGERQHYLDQLRSLYEAGMMEKDEYNERVAAIEAEYRGMY